MGKKKSLGHNPLAYSMSRHASFDFIGTQTAEPEREERPADPEVQINKIVASYYLEETIVNKIKSIASKRDLSYSAFANSLLKQSLNEI